MSRTQQQVVTLLPRGLVAERSWLVSQGVRRHTIDNWLKSGQLLSVARGVFTRPESELTWQGVTCSLQRMGSDLAPGGLTALERLGFGHYLTLGSEVSVHLYGYSRMPRWVSGLLPGTAFVRHRPLEYSGMAEQGFDLRWNAEYLTFGAEKVGLKISGAEQAVLEVLMDVPRTVTFEHADNLVRGLATLSPTMLAKLLDHCRNVKVKRLFLWLAERNQSPWLGKLDLRKFSMDSGALGSGKRVIAEHGKLDRKFLITVPWDMTVDSLG